LYIHTNLEATVARSIVGLPTADSRTDKRVNHPHGTSLCAQLG